MNVARQMVVTISNRPSPTRQIDWVDQRLWQWGAWVQHHDTLGNTGSALGRMYKQRMKELRVWDGGATAPANLPGDDDTMLAVDRAVALAAQALEGTR